MTDNTKQILRATEEKESKDLRGKAFNILNKIDSYCRTQFYEEEGETYGLPLNRKYQKDREKLIEIVINELK